MRSSTEVIGGGGVSSSSSSFCCCFFAGVNNILALWDFKITDLVHAEKERSEFSYADC